MTLAQPNGNFPEDTPRLAAHHDARQRDGTMNADDLTAAIAQRCDQAHQTATGWQACCPAHEDSTPSLAITPGRDKVLLKCHAGCTVNAIVAALGMTMADLFLRPTTPNTTKHIVKVYDYLDANGHVLHQTVRYADPKDFKQRRPDPAKPGDYIWSLKGIEPVLYHLPDVLAAVHRGETVYLCEGEKDAVNVQALGLTATTNPMGAASWRTSYTETLRGAAVVLLPDHDEAGQKRTAKVAPALYGTVASLKVLELPGLAEHGDVSDWLAAGGTRASLEALVDATPVWTPTARLTPARGTPPTDTPAPDAASEDPRPVIQLTAGVDIRATVDTAQQAILALPGEPQLYQRARLLCRMARGIKSPLWLQRSLDAPVIVDANLPYLRELSQQAAQWWKYDKRAKSWDPAHPPPWYLETLADRQDWPFPVLQGVMTAPTLRPDGSVLDTPGYDPDTGLYLDYNGVTFPALPAMPTLDAARSAIGELQEVLWDFLFVEVHGTRFHYPFAAALAAILSLACRSAILGSVPLFAVTSTTPGSGKGLLVDVLSIIGTGRPAPRWPQSDDDAEDRKRLLTVGMAGDPCIHIDNVLYPLGSPALDLALTAPSITDRIMGKNVKVEAPLNMVWFASGNNLQYKGDLSRRVVPVPLDPKMERPEQRTGFKHDPLPAWIREHRPRLVIAALTIVKAYFAADCPTQPLTAFGSFQEWSDLVRSCLVWAGEADCCEGRKNLAAESSQYQELGRLLECWSGCYPEQRQGITLNRVVQDISSYAAIPGSPANRWDELRSALAAYDPRYDGEKLSPRIIGFAFRTIQGRVIDGKRLVKVGEEHRTSLWRLETC
jgi:putative DNA primase/helicase